MQKKYPIIRGICVLLSLIIFPYPSPAADSGEKRFQDAETFRSKYLKDEKQMRYRDIWLACIEKYQSAYNADPKGNHAPASLYMTGKLYHDLYRRSYRKSDMEAARENLGLVIKRFPKTDHCKKAEAILAAATGTGQPSVKEKNADSLKKNKKTADEPSSADSGIKIKERGDLFKKTKEAYRLSSEPGRETVKAASEPPAAESIAKAAPSPPAPSPPPLPPPDATVVHGLRVWSNPNYTRIVVDADKETRYFHGFLDKDDPNNKPKRLYIDYDKSVLGKDLKTVLTIDDDLLIGARAGQNTLDSVRVVIDIKSFKTYKIFHLSNPFRTIIDIWGKDSGVIVPSPQPSFRPDVPESPPPQKPEVYEAAVSFDAKITPNDLAKQLALGVRRIVIDPGHGGHDGGAPGHYKGLKEKDIVLEIAQLLARKIRSQMGVEVIMTRSTDRYLTLEERTAIANTKNADLFISIHCNASRNRNANGIETYFLNLATDEDAVAVAARENAASRKNISDLQAILHDLMKNAKINESSRLAAHVQNSLHAHLSRHYGEVKNKGVKQAPFYVLLGAQMPSILVETSFISNPVEAKRLMSETYQDHLTNAILNGVRNYIKETSPTAFMNPAQKPGHGG